MNGIGCIGFKHIRTVPCTVKISVDADSFLRVCGICAICRNMTPVIGRRTGEGFKEGKSPPLPFDKFLFM